jgi:hypothetical protein
MAACKQQRDDLQQNTAIFGNWQAGQTPVLRALIFDGGDVLIAQDQRFELEFSDGTSGTFLRMDDEYILQSSRVPAPGEHVTLKWYLDGDTAFARVHFPPEPIFNSGLPDTVAISKTQDALITWSVSGEYEFALRLESLEQNPVPLPVSPGNFDSQYAGPQVASQLNLNVELFSYFGHYRLIVTVLNEDLLDSFFFDPSDIRGLLQNGPDNVEGARGFVTAVATKELIVKVE